MKFFHHTGKVFAAGLFAALTVTMPAGAAVITDGFTFAVASGSDTSVGTHFHSSTGGEFGNPAGKAEVGRFSSEEVRGLSEYDLTGLASAASAFVTFEVFSAGGLFSGVNDFPFDGTIQIEAYAGNNLEDIPDYQAASLGIVGTFSTVGLIVGNTLSFDITSIFNDAITNSLTSLGIRLRANPLNDAGAWVFDTFRLTTDDLTTRVPEPSVLLLFVAGLAGLGMSSARRRRRRLPNAA